MSQSVEDDSTLCMLSAPFESVSAALQALSVLTSSTRKFFSECFPCSRGYNGCFDQTDSSSDGAWFDCDQLQAEHPFCFVNPVPVTAEDKSVYDRRHKDGVILSNMSSKETSETQSKERVAVVRSETLLLTESSPPKCDRTNSPPGRRPKFKYKNGIPRSASSFASKLEEDRYYGYLNKALRADGEIRPSAEVKTEPVHRPSIRSPILQRKENILPVDFNLLQESCNWDACSLDSDDGEGEFKEEFQKYFCGEVWRPAELEDAFNVYNELALQMYGFQPENSVPKYSLSYKTSTDKYEDSFPVHLSKSLSHSAGETAVNNKHTRKTHPSSSSLPDLHDPAPADQGNVVDINDNKKSFDEFQLSEAELKDFISICIFSVDLNEIDQFQEECNNYKYHCDKLLSYSYRSFKRNLLFDLVKEIVTEYLIQYKSSILLCSEYPVHSIQDKITNILTFNREINYGHMSHDVKAVRHMLGWTDKATHINEKVTDEKIVENVVAEEIRKEGILWQNTYEEETELKSEIYNEIYTCLINDELNVIIKVLKSKRTSFNDIN